MLEKIPKKVYLADITIRDGFQHEEKLISTDAKVFYAEQLILAGIRKLELTNLGNPKRMPQFKDANELLRRVRNSRVIGCKQCWPGMHRGYGADDA
jgi:hydroxymethylglutaryl-CoA lyase